MSLALLVRMNRMMTIDLNKSQTERYAMDAERAAVLDEVKAEVQSAVADQRYSFDSDDLIMLEIRNCEGHVLRAMDVTVDGEEIP